MESWWLYPTSGTAVVKTGVTRERVASASLAELCQLFEWEQVAGLYLPVTFRNGRKYLSVRIADSKLLSRFGSVIPTELKRQKVVTSYYITEAESLLLSRINKEVCKNEYGTTLFTTADVIVSLEKFKEFYTLVDDTVISTDHIRFSHCKGGWIQLNNTVCPYIWCNAVRHVPLEVVKLAAELLTDEADIPILKVTAKQLDILNAMCGDAQRTFTFNEDTTLISLVFIKLRTNPVIIELPPNAPFEHARYIDPDCDPAAIEQLKQSGKQALDSYYSSIVLSSDPDPAPPTHASTSVSTPETLSDLTNSPPPEYVPPPEYKHSSDSLPASDSGVVVSERVSPSKVAAARHSSNALICDQNTSNQSQNSNLHFQDTSSIKNQGQSSHMNTQQQNPMQNKQQSLCLSAERQQPSQGFYGLPARQQQPELPQQQILLQQSLQGLQALQQPPLQHTNVYQQQPLQQHANAYQQQPLQQQTNAYQQLPPVPEIHQPIFLACPQALLTNGVSQPQVPPGSLQSHELCYSNGGYNSYPDRGHYLPNEYQQSVSSALPQLPAHERQGQYGHVMMVCPYPSMPDPMDAFRAPEPSFEEKYLPPSVRNQTWFSQNQFVSRTSEAVTSMHDIAPMVSQLKIEKCSLLVLQMISRCNDFCNKIVHLSIKAQNLLESELAPTDVIKVECLSVLKDMCNQFAFWNASSHLVTASAAEKINSSLIRVCLGDHPYSYRRNPDIVHHVLSGVFGVRTISAASNFRFVQEIMSCSFIMNGKSNLHPTFAYYHMSRRLNHFIVPLSNWCRFASSVIQPNISVEQFKHDTYNLFEKVYSTMENSMVSPQSTPLNMVSSNAPAKKRKAQVKRTSSDKSDTNGIKKGKVSLPVCSEPVSTATVVANTSTAAEMINASLADTSAPPAEITNRSTSADTISIASSDDLGLCISSVTSLTNKENSPATQSSKTILATNNNNNKTKEVCHVTPLVGKSESAADSVVLTRIRGKKLPSYKKGIYTWLLIEDVHKTYFPRLPLAEVLERIRQLAENTLWPLGGEVAEAFRDFYDMTDEEMFEQNLMISAQDLNSFLDQVQSKDTKADQQCLAKASSAGLQELI